MGARQSRNEEEETSPRFLYVTFGELIVIFLLLLLGWLVITSWSFFFERLVLRRLKSLGAIFGTVIVMTGLYLSISMASGTFLFLPSLGSVEDFETGETYEVF